MKEVLRMLFRVRELSLGKERRRSTKQRFPISCSVQGFEKVHYSTCTIVAVFEEETISLQAVALQNPVTGKWTINGIDSNYNQVVLEVYEEDIGTNGNEL